MKKILALILCFVLLSCSVVTVFAQDTEVADDAGEVLYYQQFGKDGDALIVEDVPSTGLALGDTGVTTIDKESGYLKATVGSTTTRKKIVTIKDVIPDDGTYTVEFTYRLTYARYNASSIQLGWGTSNLNILEITGNGGLKFTYENETSTALAYQDGYTTDTNFTGTGELEGNWITVKVEVENNVVKAHTFIANGNPYTYDVNYDVYNGEEIIADDLYLRSYSADADFSSIRVVKGVGYTGYKGEMAETSYSELTNDNTLYYQRFGKDASDKIIVDSLAAAGMTADKGTINDNGYFTLSATGGTRNVGAYLPIQLPETDSYTVELTYRYSEIADSNNGAMQIGWGECTSGYYHLLQFQTGYGLKFTEYETEGDTNTVHQPNNSWPADYKAGMTTANKWIKATVIVENDKITTCKFNVDGQTFEMKNSDYGYNSYDITMGDYDQLYFRIYRATAEVESIRVTKGSGDLDYTGVYADTTYNGYVVPKVANVGMQKALASDAVRLVSEIQGVDFDAAGFEVKISYNDEEGTPVESSAELSPVYVHSAYTSILAGDGTETPSASDYYLIVLEISEIPAYANDIVIRFRPFATDSEGTYYGATYEYNHTSGDFVVVAE